MGAGRVPPAELERGAVPVVTLVPLSLARRKHQANVCKEIWGRAYWLVSAASVGLEARFRTDKGRWGCETCTPRRTRGCACRYDDRWRVERAAGLRTTGTVRSYGRAIECCTKRQHGFVVGRYKHFIHTASIGTAERRVST